MPTVDIFNFDSPDLVNLQIWLKKKPRQFRRAAAGVANTMAFEARKLAIKNIERNTTVRSKPFISRSMRVDKAKPSANLNNIVAVMGSIDISRQGRSDGFLSLETGGRSKSTRVPTLASRGGNEKRKVAGKVRMNKQTRFFKRQMFKGKGRRTKQQQIVAMLKAVRGGAIGRDPFILEGRQRGRMARMKPGVWGMGNSKRVNLMNPFRGKRGPVRRIGWMSKAVREVSSDTNLRRIWSKEIDFILRRK